MFEVISIKFWSTIDAYEPISLTQTFVGAQKSPKRPIQHFNVGIYASRNVYVKDIGSWVSMVLQNYQKFIEMTSNMIHICTY